MNTPNITDPAMDVLQREDRGDREKWLAMLALGLGSIIAGMLPALVSERNRRRFPLTISLLLCFGAGILLATALVHILPEVRKQMDSNYAEICVCGGFFIIYFIDEFIHFFFGEAIQHTHPPQRQGANASTGNGFDYGTLRETSSLLPSHQNGHNHHEDDHHVHNHSDSADLYQRSHRDHSAALCDEAADAANARLCHTSHVEPCEQSLTGTLGLFVALSLHSAIEGLAIGVQSSAAKVLFLLGAVACHKFVMVFCLGLELRSNPLTSLQTQFIGITIFALGAVSGIGLGMVVVDLPAIWSTKTLPVIQALAGGTLFYVTVCEVMPREKARWHQNPTRRAAGFAQFFAVALGFTSMCLINYFLDDDA